jgi:hypothetical protein
MAQPRHCRVVPKEANLLTRLPEVSQGSTWMFDEKLLNSV